MKKLILFSFLCLMSVPMNAEDTDISSIDNVVYIEPCTAEAGSEYTLSVKMKNSIVAEGFGFDLVLPTGMTVALDEYGDPKAMLSTVRTDLSKTNHFDADFKLDGTLNIQAYSSKGRAISGNDGEVAIITIKIAGDMPLGTYPLKLTNIAISDENSVTYTVDFVETSIVIVKGDSRTILDESSLTVPSASTQPVDVLVKRTIKAGEWSTICLPFAMTEAQVKAAFGDDVQLGDFNDYEYVDATDAIRVNFQSATAIEANHPYIIKVSTPVSEFTADGVDIDPQEAIVDFDTSRRKNQPRQFVGTYVANTVLDWGTLFLSDNKFWYSTGNTKMKAFRAYFNLNDLIPDFEDNYESRVSIVFGDDITTGISLYPSLSQGDGAVYDLQGRRVDEPKAKGIYIVNGKKIKK